MWLLVQRFPLVCNRGTRPGRPIPCRSKPKGGKTKVVQEALLRKQHNTTVAFQGWGRETL